MYTLINKFTISRIIAFAVILFFFFLISILTLENMDVISLDRPYSKKYCILECFFYDLLIFLFPFASLFVYFKFNLDAVCIFVFGYLNIVLLDSIVFYSEPLRLDPFITSSTINVFKILFASAFYCFLVHLIWHMFVYFSKNIKLGQKFSLFCTILFLLLIYIGKSFIILFLTNHRYYF
jgi:hypothetical protein